MAVQESRRRVVPTSTIQAEHTFTEHCPQMRQCANWTYVSYPDAIDQHRGRARARFRND